MQLLIKQRVFSWSDTYDIYDEQGNQKYFVKNEFISLGHRLHVYDAAHNEIGFIKQKLFCFLPTFEIEWNGQLMGHIEKRFALFRPKYDVDFMGWRAEGDFMGWDYDVYEACSVAAHISKIPFHWGDTYELNVMIIRAMKFRHYYWCWRSMRQTVHKIMDSWWCLEWRQGRCGYENFGKYSVVYIWRHVRRTCMDFCRMHLVYYD